MMPELIAYAASLSSHPASSHVYLGFAAAASALSIWLLARALAPIIRVVRMVASAALAFVAIGVALAFVLLMLANR